MGYYFPGSLEGLNEVTAQSSHSININKWKLNMGIGQDKIGSAVK